MVTPSCGNSYALSSLSITTEPPPSLGVTANPGAVADSLSVSRIHAIRRIFKQVDSWREGLTWSHHIMHHRERHCSRGLVHDQRFAVLQISPYVSQMSLKLSAEVSASRSSRFPMSG